MENENQEKKKKIVTPGDLVGKVVGKAVDFTLAGMIMGALGLGFGGTVYGSYLGLERAYDYMTLPRIEMRDDNQCYHLTIDSPLIKKTEYTIRYREEKR